MQAGLAVFILALLWDLALGEPPGKLHPVVWFGRVAGLIDSRYGRRSPALDFLAGLLAAVFVIISAVLLSIAPSHAPFPINYLIAIYFLKSSFAIRSLHEHVARTVTDEVEEKRRAVSMIVSRDTSELDQAHLNSAAIESLAENLNDSVVAPLFYFLLFGLPGALVYRAVNTLDAMLGYRTPRYEYFGKFSARLDDLLNFIPARLTVLLYLPLCGGKVLEYYRLARFKLNSDKPIGAMSAVLRVWLEKQGLYRFPGREPRNEDIERALRVYWLVVGEWVLIVVVFLVKVSLEIILENVGYLTGKAASFEVCEQIKKRALNVPNVLGIHDLRAHYVGPKLHVELHIEVPQDMTLKEAHDVSEEVKRRIEEMEEVETAFVHVDINGVTKYK